MIARTGNLLLLLTAALTCAVPLGAADWPRALGPDGTGVSPETGLADSWPTGGPPLRWTIEPGPGYGGAAVRDGEVYCLDREMGKADILRCHDLETGKEKWRYTWEAKGEPPYPGSRSTPTVTEKFVYVIGIFGDVHCIDRKSHKPVWSMNMIKRFHNRRLPAKLRAQAPRWGVAQFPIVDGDRLLLAPRSADAGVVAVNRFTGKVLWKSGDVGRPFFAHVSPYVAELEGVRQAVILANVDRGKNPPAVVTGINVSTGETLWQCRTPHALNIPIPMPTQISENQLFITGGYRFGAGILEVSKPEKDGGPWATRWRLLDRELCTAHVHTPLWYEGHLYAQSFDKFHNKVNDGLVCVSPQGKRLWRSADHRDVANHRIDFDSGGLLIADGKIFVLHGRTGELAMVKASPEGYKELGRTQALPARRRTAWAPLALSQGRLIVRDQEVMRCFDLRQDAKADDASTSNPSEDVEVDPAEVE